MKLQKMLFLLLIMTVTMTTSPGPARAFSTQSTKLYQQLTQREQTAFVAVEARRLARQISGNDYEFTAEFEAEIQKAVDAYARRIGNNRADSQGNGDARFIFERGQIVAPALMKAFAKANVSPLIGLYLPLIESEYMNLQSPNSMGAVGMFQFLPQTGEQYGLGARELLDLEKSADAAARYIAVNLQRFSGDPMKEALALLAYNRGGGNVERDVAELVNEQNRACSICAMTAQRDKLDQNFQRESVDYVPRFFAAAIIGENPQAFGLPMKPLSQY